MTHPTPIEEPHKDWIEKQIEEFDLVVAHFDWWNDKPLRERVADWLRARLALAYTQGEAAGREEAVDYIGTNEGWEESEDLYRRHFGLPIKYPTKEHNETTV